MKIATLSISLRTLMCCTPAVVAMSLASPSDAAVVLPTVSSGVLAVHLDASTGVTVNGSNVVTNWADQSGNGHNFQLASGAPTLVSNAFNGEAVVRFDISGGPDALFQTGGDLNNFLSINTGLTIFMVTQNTLPDGIPATAETDRLDGLFVSQPGVSGSIRTRFNGMNAVGDTGVELKPNAAGSVDTFRVSLQDDPGTLAPTLVRYYEGFTLSNDGAATTGTQFTAVTATNTSFPFVNTRIGEADGAGFTGDLAQFVIYKGALNDTDRAAVASALAGVYAIPEPSTGLLLAGAGLLGAFRRRRSGRA